MTARRPLVIDKGQLEQLQGSDDLDIPLGDRVALLERLTCGLAKALLAGGALSIKDADDDLLELLVQKGILS